jgi:hypothetical protein
MYIIFLKSEGFETTVISELCIVSLSYFRVFSPVDKAAYQENDLLSIELGPML